MEKTLNDAIEFARKHGMTIDEVGDRRLKVMYPSGEFRIMSRDCSDTPRIIADMACNLF